MQNLTVSSAGPVKTLSKSSSRAKKLVFTLKEESDNNQESSSSDGSDIDLDMDEEEVPVFYDNPITGKKSKCKKLSYKMSYVNDRVGAKINLKDQYFDAIAVQSYTEKGKRLLKYVKKDDG